MLLAVGQIHQLLDLAPFAARGFGVELHRLLEHLVGKLAKAGALQCGGEEHGLLAPARFGSDAIHFADKAHVQHAVGFIQDQDLDGAAIEALLLDILHQPSRRGDDDVCGLGQGRQLLFVLHATYDAFDHQMGMGRQRAGMFGDLQCQLAGGGEDQHPGGASPTTGKVQQMLHGRQQEGGGLARARGGGGQNIETVHGHRDHLLLYGGGANKAHLGDAAEQGRIKIEGVEGHGVILG